MTRKELNQMATQIAELIRESQDEILPLDEVRRRYGWSKSFFVSQGESRDTRSDENRWEDFLFKEKYRQYYS